MEYIHIRFNEEVVRRMLSNDKNCSMEKQFSIFYSNEGVVVRTIKKKCLSSFVDCDISQEFEKNYRVAHTNKTE